MNSKIIKNSWRVVLIVSTILIIYSLNSKGKKSYESFYENEIIGVIDSIYYGDKNQAIVKIKNTEYSLWLFKVRKGEDLKKGDSLYKGRNSKKLELHSKTINGNYICTEIYEMK